MPRYIHIDSEDPHYLQELTPNLCVARHAGAALHAPSGRPFTSNTGVRGLGWAPIDGVSRFDMVVAAGSKYTGRSISGQLFNQFQIGLSVGFLIQELDGQLPCILITGAPVDSITVAAAYLALKLGQPIGAIIEAIDSHKDIRKCWKGLLPEEGMRKLSEIVLHVPSRRHVPI
ncbi:hypothetical protein FIBSPDRAFT_852263 [Athelia psychrophila]|uniref:Uncharacterized protein n=1 Tax=Athelia psychrophila TaxID=1759441 RepID=A0A166S480_9AGAM|nr:hypothetical protein FIBSPDRAFT_852263 [Fibularhizoctonia sp. CBS 109695]